MANLQPGQRSKIAICRVIGLEKESMKVYLIAPEGGKKRTYLLGGVSEGPAFSKKITEAPVASLEEAERKCEELAKQNGFEEVRIIIPQKAPKNKLGHRELVRLGFTIDELKDMQLAMQSVGYKAEKILFEPTRIVRKVLMGGRKKAKKAGKVKVPYIVKAVKVK